MFQILYFEPILSHLGQDHNVTIRRKLSIEVVLWPFKKEVIVVSPLLGLVWWPLGLHYFFKPVGLLVTQLYFELTTLKKKSKTCYDQNVSIY